MTTFTQWQPLLPGELEGVPGAPGVFQLATLVRTVVYIGAAPDLAAALAQHMSPTVSPSSPGRRYFRYVLTDRAEQLQHQLLADYQRSHQGMLPAVQSTPYAERDVRRHLKAV